MSASLACEDWQYSEDELTGIVYDIIRDIRDPEKPESLEDLEVVYEHGVAIDALPSGVNLISVEFAPTVPHCNLATLIGLCIRVKLQKELPVKHKLDITIKEGTHDLRNEVQKQINDKERVAAAMENPNLCKLVQQCIQPPDS